MYMFLWFLVSVQMFFDYDDFNYLSYGCNDMFYFDIQGDSGGLFVCKFGIKWDFQGIVLWGNGCVGGYISNMFFNQLNYKICVQVFFFFNGI